MCISAAVIAGASLVVGAAGTIASIDNANYQAGMMELQLAEQRDQMREQRELEKLAAKEAELARLREFSENREANLLALAASGVGQSMSFMQGREVADRKALEHDLSNIRLGDAVGSKRFADQIRVNRLQGQVAQTQKKSAVFGSLLDFAGDAVGAASYYGKNR